MGTVVPLRPRQEAEEAARLEASDTEALRGFAFLPTLVGLTVRRRVGGRWWDISIDALRYPDPATGERRTCYSWAAKESPPVCGEAVRFVAYRDTPAEALADAEAAIAARER